MYSSHLLPAWRVQRSRSACSNLMPNLKEKNGHSSPITKMFMCFIFYEYKDMKSISKTDIGRHFCANCIQIKTFPQYRVGQVECHETRSLRTTTIMRAGPWYITKLTSEYKHRNAPFLIGGQLLQKKMLS